MIISGRERLGGNTGINGSFLGSLLLLLFVALAADRGGQESLKLIVGYSSAMLTYLDLFTLDLKVRFVLRGIKWKAGYLQWAVWHEKSGEFELSDDILFLLKLKDSMSGRKVKQYLTRTGKGVIRPWLTHSLMPILAFFSSSRDRRLKHIASNFFSTSEKMARKNMLSC